MNIAQLENRFYRPHLPFATDAERLEHLFRKYEEMAAAETLFAKPKKARATR